jgi:dihydrofolate reductase
MRKIIVLSFITLDGVMQAPGGPDEDRENNFEFGGWIAPYSDEGSDEIMKKQLEPADLLLGRKTFDIWENYWPEHSDNWPGVNEVTKYVLSKTRSSSDWSNCVFLENVEDLRKLKNSDGGDIKIWGSSEVVQLLLKHDMVDEFRLNMYPVVLGKGKRLFDNEAMPKAYTLADSFITSTGVIMAHYKKAGDVRTGNAGE